MTSILQSPSAAAGVTDALESFARQISRSVLQSIYKVRPGRVLEFHRESGTVDLELPILSEEWAEGAGEVRNQSEAQAIPPLRISGAIVLSAGRTQGGYARFSVEPGDFGLVIFCDRSLGNWRPSGATDVPDGRHLHNPADAFFLPGLRSDAERIPDDMEPDEPGYYLREERVDILADDSAGIVAGESIEIVAGNGDARLATDGGGTVRLGDLDAIATAKRVARVGDGSAPSETFATWISAVSTALSIPPPDLSRIAIIAQGSAKVRATD